MKRPAAPLLVAIALLLTACLPLPAQVPSARTGGQDFVILGELQPVLVRVHVEVDGKPLQARWEHLLKELFAYLDVNSDGALNKDEAARAPSTDQLLSGGIGLGRQRGSGSAGIELKNVDTDKDGKVSRSELAAYYRKNGLAPFQFRLTAEEMDAVALAVLNGPQAEPTIDVVSKTIFTLLDRNNDGKLTRAELSAALDLLDRDDNEDEILTTRELVYSKGVTSSGGNGVMAALVRKGMAAVSAPGKTVVPLDGSSAAEQGLVRALQERYGKSAAREKELAGFTKREPDLELVLRLGASEPTAAAVERIGRGGKRPRLGGLPERALLDLGRTRIEVRSSEESYSNRLADLIQQQLVGQLDQADHDGNGYLDEKEASKSPVFRTLFKTLDRDGDGKVNKTDLLSYLHQAQRLQARALAGCVSLVQVDQSRGLFDLLDTSRDGRLGVRELRQAAGLLETLDRDRRGYLTAADIPRSYQLLLRRGPAQQDGLRQLALFERYYGSSYAEESARSQRGPTWFCKMDRNRDGDVSRKEFLFVSEQFRRLDTNGDGLISVEEAEKASALPHGDKVRE